MNDSPNYPNPFHLFTSRTMGSAGEGLVSLKVYDILGKEITTLVNEAKFPGTYQVEFNGAALASGVYIYKLTAGEYSASRKMLLLK